MGTADRDYFRDEERRYSGGGGGGGLPPLTPMARALLIINIAAFLFDWLLFNQELSRRGDFNVAFSVPISIYGGRVWELLSFQFLHEGLLSLISNSFSLWLFGRWVEPWWSSRRFLIFYLLCGVAGAVVYTLLVMFKLMPPGVMVGASGGIYGCLVAVVVIDPKSPVRFFSPSVTVKRLAQIVLGFSAIWSLVTMFAPKPDAHSNPGAQAALLAGAVMGYALMRFSKLLGRRAEEAAKAVRSKEKEYRSEAAGSSATRKKKPKPASKLRPRTTLETATATEVDRILDKINKEGMQSLTAEEQAILKGASESRKDR